MGNDILIRVEGVSKRFCRNLKKSLWYGVKDSLADFVGRGSVAHDLRPDEFWAVDGVSFELRRGECLGLVGRNGAGKTTLLKMLNGLIKPDGGRIEMHGRVGALIALGAGFNPILTGRENIYINGAVLGLSRREIDHKIDDIIEFADIGTFIDAPVQNYSSGMQVRLGFAIATALEPDVLLLDEVLAVGDDAFRSKCFDRIGKILTSAAVIFVSHNEAQIYRICNRAILLRDAKMIEEGTPEAVLATYRLENQQFRPDQSKIADARLINIQLKTENVVHYGQKMEIGVNFESKAEFKIGAIFVHLWHKGNFVAVGEALFKGDDALTFGAGKSEFSVNLESLCLSSGKYTVSFSAFDETRKKTIVQWLHFASIDVHGPVGVGSPYLIPITISSSRGEIHIHAKVGT